MPRQSRVDLTSAIWRKSSRSSGNGGQCVEFADNIPGTVAVRDSKNPLGPVLLFTPDAWAAFVSDVKKGNLHA